MSFLYYCTANKQYFFVGSPECSNCKIALEEYCICIKTSTQRSKKPLFCVSCSNCTKKIVKRQFVWYAQEVLIATILEDIMLLPDNSIMVSLLKKHEIGSTGRSLYEEATRKTNQPIKIINHCKHQSFFSEHLEIGKYPEEKILLGDQYPESEEVKKILYAKPYKEKTL